MDSQAQPNFEELTQSFENVAHQVSLIPNLNFVHHSQQVTHQLQQMRDITTRILEELVELRNATNSISIRIDVKLVRSHIFEIFLSNNLHLVTQMLLHDFIIHI